MSSKKDMDWSDVDSDSNIGMLPMADVILAGIIRLSKVLERDFVSSFRSNTVASTKQSDSTSLRVFTTCTQIGKRKKKKSGIYQAEKSEISTCTCIEVRLWEEKAQLQKFVNTLTQLRLEKM